MRYLFVLLALVAAVGLVYQGADGQEKKAEKKEVTLKGEITCGKCDLGVDKACATVIVAKNKDKKDVVFYFDPAGHKKYHSNVCTAGKPGSVTGVVSKEGKKNIITVKTVKFD